MDPAPAIPPASQPRTSHRELLSLCLQEVNQLLLLTGVVADEDKLLAPELDQTMDVEYPAMPISSDVGNNALPSSSQQYAQKLPHFSILQREKRQDGDQERAADSGVLQPSTLSEDQPPPVRRQEQPTSASVFAGDTTRRRTTMYAPSGIDVFQSTDTGIASGDDVGLSVELPESRPMESSSFESEAGAMDLWRPKVTFRSHLETVRTLAYHPTQPFLLSAGDDCMLKIWNLDGIGTHKGKDYEPIATYRGHHGAILAAQVSPLTGHIYTADVDSMIIEWKFPTPDHEVYSPHDPSVRVREYVGHSDVIWDLQIRERGDLMASCSADGRVKIWDLSMGANVAPLLLSFDYDGASTGAFTKQPSHRNPVAMAFPTYSDDLLVAYRNSIVRLYDLTTGQVKLSFSGTQEMTKEYASTQINALAMHPSSSLAVTGHEDRHLRYYDARTGKCEHAMTAHLDAVSCLDLMETTLVSGGHDGSIRLWDTRTYTCIQEFTAHRRKRDEAVCAVKFNTVNGRRWLASAGADSLVKLSEK